MVPLKKIIVWKCYNILNILKLSPDKFNFLHSDAVPSSTGFVIKRKYYVRAKSHHLLYGHLVKTRLLTD